MWELRRYSPADRREIRSTIDDMLKTTSRNFMLLSEVFFTFFAIIVAGNATAEVMGVMLLTAAGLGLVTLLAYRALEQRYRLAQLVWQAAMLLAFWVTARVVNHPDLMLFSILVPFISVVTLGWWGGLGAQVVVALLVEWALHSSPALALPELYVWVAVALGGVIAVLGGAANAPLLLLAEWSFFNFNQAQNSLEEAREQRLELNQAQADLLLANRELARLSERLAALQRIAEEARQAKSEFVANVSHELRTPLNMIIGFTEVIAKSPNMYGNLPAALMTDINAIQRSSRHLLGLVNDVLDLSQVEAGRMALSREWASIPEIVQNAVLVVKSLFDSKGLYLEVDQPAELPQVYCDRLRVQEVLINLLSNAGRFTRHGGVRVACRQENETVLVSVSDTGPGIPSEDQPRLFEPFQQLDNSIRRKYGGSGLGLTISKQFVEMHGGKMGLTSRQGEGTTFFFSLPVFVSLSQEIEAGSRIRRALIPDDETGYNLRTRPSRAPVVPTLSTRMVVLEQEQSLQKLVRRYMPDVETVRAASAAEAVAELNRSPAQALLANLAPSQEGVLEELEKVPYGTPIISCWVPGEVEAARQLRVVNYLVKPVTREKLLATLAELDGRLQTILVVDDEPDELHLFARMLESDRPDFQILQVTNGKRALDMLRRRKPDVMLLDLAMPVMDGYQVLEEKHQDPSISDIPVIVLSSRDPAGNLIMSKTLRVTQNSGLTINNLAECIQSVAQILAPSNGARI